MAGQEKHTWGSSKGRTCHSTRVTQPKHILYPEQQAQANHYKKINKYKDPQAEEFVMLLVIFWCYFVLYIEFEITDFCKMEGMSLRTSGVMGRQQQRAEKLAVESPVPTSSPHSSKGKSPSVPSPSPAGLWSFGHTAPLHPMVIHSTREATVCLPWPCACQATENASPARKQTVNSPCSLLWTPHFTLTNMSLFIFSTFMRKVNNIFNFRYHEVTKHAHTHKSRQGADITRDPFYITLKQKMPLCLVKCHPSKNIFYPNSNNRHG